MTFFWCSLLDHNKVGENLRRVDPQSYPYCGWCGARESEGWAFQWYNQEHLNIREIIRKHKLLNGEI